MEDKLAKLTVTIKAWSGLTFSEGKEGIQDLVVFLRAVIKKNI